MVCREGRSYIYIYARVFADSVILVGRGGVVKEFPCSDIAGKEGRFDYGKEEVEIGSLTAQNY